MLKIKSELTVSLRKYFIFIFFFFWFPLIKLFLKLRINCNEYERKKNRVVFPLLDDFFFNFVSETS